MSEEEDAEEPAPFEPVVPRPINDQPLLDPELIKAAQMKKYMAELEAGERPKEMSFVDYLVYQDMQDRREERRIRRERRTTITEGDVARIAREAVSPPSTEPSEETKLILQRLERMEQREKKREQRDRDQELIDKAIEPLNVEIEKRDQIIDQMQERLEKLESSEPAGEGGSFGLDEYLDYDQKLKDSGILRKKESATITMAGPDGLPIKGEIPGPVVWFPWMLDRLKEPITDIIDEVGKRWMKARASAPSKPQPAKLINLPEPPKVEIPPAPKPPLPKVETKQPLIKMPPPQPPAPKTEPKEPLIKTSPPSPKLQVPPKLAAAAVVAAREITYSLTRENLQKKKMAELWPIAKNLNIPKKGKKKADLIEAILNKVKQNEHD